LERVKNWDLNVFNPAGGIRSTANDMMRFVEANLGKRPTALDDAIALTHERRHDTESGGMALGWHLAPDGSTYWHNGMTGGYYAFVGFSKRFDCGVVLLCNTASLQLDQLGAQLLRLLAGANEQPAAFPKPVKVNAKVLEGYVGAYQLTPQFVLTVTRQDDRLYVQATGQDKYRIYADSPTVFFYRIVEAKITFDVGRNGKAKALTLHQGGLELPGKRVK
jgi:CubicO group peptidase (beta-lactamase class C family)